MNYPDQLAFAVRCVILGIPGIALHPAALAQDQPSEAVEEVLVTGSRIKRSNFEEGSQVVQLDEFKIDLQNALIMADVLRSSPLNSYGSLNEQSGSTAQSNATINLRGLGDQRTLVTLDGRRMVGSPNQGAAVININMIPHSAIRSVDILADGASAVYGSDAVAGVVNMNLHSGFEGFEFAATYGDRANDDGTEHSLSLLGGMSGDRGNITFALEKSHRSPIWDADREYTAARAEDTNGNGVIDAEIETEGYSLYGKSIDIWDGNTEYYDLQAATTCDADGENYMVASAEMAYGIPNSTVCLYNFASISANKAELDKTSAYVNIQYELSDTMELYVNSLVSRVESFGRYAPPAAEWPGMPADNGDVPFDVDALLDAGAITDDYFIQGYYRWTNIGPRDNVVTDTQFDFTAGLRGDIADGLSYDVYLQDSRYDVKEFGYYYLSLPGLDYVLSSGGDPLSEDVAGAMSATTTQDNFNKMLKSYGHLQFDSGNWFGAGESIILLGAEYFDVDYQNKYDRQTEQGLVGGASGNSSKGERDVTALFGELLLPITDGIEINAALRYDDYSDFGTAVSPTISATWSIAEDLVFRGRWGQGFRAPGLDELYGPESFSAELAVDYVACAEVGTSVEDCPTTQIDTNYYTNEALEAENSESLSFGINWGILENLKLDVGYWDILIKDRITQPLAQSIINAEYAGVDLSDSGTYVDRSAGLPEIHTTYVNTGELGANGLDFQLNGYLDSRMGVFSMDLFIVHTLGFDQPAYHTGPKQDTSGFNLQPELKAQWGFGWEFASSFFSLVFDYVGPSAEANVVEVPENGQPYLRTEGGDLDSWTTINMSYSYDFQTFGRVKVGARNLTNEDPVLDKDGKYPREHFDLYDNTGRVVFVEYKIGF